MIFKCLDGTIIKKDISFASYIRQRHKSNFQQKIYEYLSKMFGYMNILEQFTIPKEQLYLDFFIPTFSCAIQVNGAQHYQYSQFFHGSQLAFKNSIGRDKRKQAWCDLNNIMLIIIDDPDITYQELKKYVLA